MVDVKIHAPDGSYNMLERSLQSPKTVQHTPNDSNQFVGVF